VVYWIRPLANGQSRSRRVWSLWWHFTTSSGSLKYIGGGTGKTSEIFYMWVILIDRPLNSSFVELKDRLLMWVVVQKHTFYPLKQRSFARKSLDNRSPITCSENTSRDVPIFVSDSRKVMSATSWRPQDATGLTEIYGGSTNSSN